MGVTNTGRLAAQGRFMVLVPDSRDKVSAEVLALMAAPNEDFEIGSEVAIKPKIVSQEA